MFLGRFYHSLESKGRLAIPSQFRNLLGVKPIITRGLDGCLFLLPFKTWQKLIKEINISPLTTQDTRQFIRLIAHDAHQVEFDKQGRTLLPKNLRGYAHITKQVVVAGSLDWIEVWDRQNYHQHMKKTEKEANQVAERLTKLNHNE